MSAFGSFLLAVAAFIGTLMLISDPTQKLIEWARGKKKSELRAEAISWFENGSTDSMGNCFSTCLFILMSYIYKFAVEPLAVLFALKNKIGSQQVAYLMLAILAFYWLQYALNFTKKEPSQLKSIEVTKDDKSVEGKDIEVDEEVKLSNPVWLFVQRVLFTLPKLYLWYLFLVSWR